ncbi:MAG: UvrD-helicase domain-containing protein [Coriobacteriales bacterium]|nr:UvrD-helicase domain-containing protein [Coriobacteriales bacterium]
MTRAVADHEGRIVKILGPARSGKTEALVSRCAALVTRGVAPESILVEVSGAFAAEAFKSRLRRALGEERQGGVDALTVKNALSLCRDELGAPQAVATTGRVPRLLNDAEYNFFLEDMKTLGQPLRRLRKMLGYFYRQWADLVPQNLWQAGGEEDAVLEHLVSVLTWRKAMLRQETAFLCAGYLRSEGGKAARHRFDYVLCDDFQNMSRAEQTCLCLLAKEQLVVCGNPNQTVAPHASLPCPGGFSTFESVRRNVDVCRLSTVYGNPEVAAFADALCDHGDMDRALKAADGTHTDRKDEGRGVLLVKWDTLEEELDGITKYLRVLFNTGGLLRENRTCVLVPTAAWAHMVARLLVKRGFAVSTAGASRGLGGDLRESRRAPALVAYTKLGLLADPSDMVAWRSWCGFDDHLTNSGVWRRLHGFAAEQGLAPHDALKAAATAERAPFLQAGVLAERWKSGCDFIEKQGGRRGFSLLNAIGANGLTEFEDVARAMDGSEDAVRLLGVMQKAIDDPTAPEDAHTLHMATYASLCGCEYDNIFALSAVDGLVPRRDAFEVVSTEEERKRVMDADRRAFYNAVSKARERLVLSYFSKAELEVAERMKMQVARVRAEDGRRMAVVRPSSFLVEAGTACPGAVSGQSILAEQGLA